MLYYFERNIDYLILENSYPQNWVTMHLHIILCICLVKRTAYTFTTTLFPAFSKMEMIQLGLIRV